MILTLEQFRKSFWRRVRKQHDGCWIWTGKTNNYGYGICQFQSKEMPAHRVSYTWAHPLDPIPWGMVLDHKCRNRRCVNPDHVEVVTNVENVMRGESPFAQKSRQTHCVRGHLLSGPNLRIRNNGTRFCRACDRERARQRRKVINNAHRHALV